MGFAKPIEQYLFGNLLTEIQVIMYLKDIIRGENVLDLRRNQIVTVNKLGLETVTDGDTADFRIVAIKPSLNTVKYVLKRIEK